MDLATQPVTEKNRDAYYWRLLATAASFALFGLGGLCLRLVVFPVLGWLPGDAQTHRQRARQIVSWLFWCFVRFTTCSWFAANSSRLAAPPTRKWSAP